jgi:hypothetical protein
LEISVTLLGSAAETLQDGTLTSLSYIGLTNLTVSIATGFSPRREVRKDSKLLLGIHFSARRELSG